MATNNVLNAADFTFAPFVADVGGDSGALRLATSKNDPQIQYVIKSGYPDIACNEFMYHHVAATLGLYTQEARLFKGVAAGKYAVGIRYVPNARKFIYEEADEDNRRVFCEFKALYVVLNEADSEEFFYDAQTKVFKLDNAESFNLGILQVNSAIKYGNDKEMPPQIFEMMLSGLNNIEYGKYSILLKLLHKYYGKTAVEAAFGLMERFTTFDLSKIEPACGTLEEIYPYIITEYYLEFIRRRITACKQFVSEHNIAQFTGKY